MFIPALFIIARAWKQPRCPSVDEWIRKWWYIFTMEYYSAIKKNTFELVLMRWMKLKAFSNRFPNEVMMQYLTRHLKFLYMVCLNFAAVTRK